MGSQTRYISEWYRYFGGLADKIEGTVIPTDKPNMFNYTRYEPFGVVGLITPWNSPLLLVAYKLAPALAAGNTAVIKPSEFTSASTLEFMELIAEAGSLMGWLMWLRVLVQKLVVRLLTIRMSQKLLLPAPISLVRKSMSRAQKS